MTKLSLLLLALAFGSGCSAISTSEPYCVKSGVEVPQSQADWEPCNAPAPAPLPAGLVES